MDLRTAIDRARDHLIGLQSAQGWWKGELETNVTMDAEDLLLRHVLGVLTPGQLDASARWIRSQQRADGTWANFYGGPGDLSTTVEAYVALRLAGDDPDSPWLAKAAAFIRAEGGLSASRVFTRIWLALVGQWSWDDLPVIPPELIYLPKWMPLGVYDFACWARQTIVPLTVIFATRPRRDLPFDLAELRTGGPRPVAVGWRSWEGRFGLLDKALHCYERSPIKPLRRAAQARALEWIVRRQEADGGWGGIQPPWVYSILALHLAGYPLNHPVLVAALAGLDGFTITEDTPDGPVRRLEACQSSVWDTALAMIALADAGEPADSPVLQRAAQWLLDEEIRVVGDWAVRRPGLPPGGWAFEFANDIYPDIDDTAEVVLALRKVVGVPGDPDAVIGRAVDWTVGMRSANGAWAAFDADNTRELAYQIPFADFGAMIDPPSADVTAHMVEMLAAEGRGGSPEVRRAVRWLRDQQEPDGSWFGRWGANHIYGTGAVVPALVAAGVDPADPAIRRAVIWLEAHQDSGGGWGEDLRSYRSPDWVGRGEPTASQTAWALLALLAAGERSPAVRRGVDWLLRTQRSDGSWDEPQFTGTGFPGDFYLNYHLYRLVFPLTALGRYLEVADG